MSTNATLLMSASILLPVIVSLVKLRRIHSSYHPFLVLLFIWLLNEIIAFILIKQKQSNAVNYNIGYLVESFLIVYQFKIWGLFSLNRITDYVLLLGLTCFWIIETFILGSINTFASYFIIAHSFIITILSITMINKLIHAEKKGLMKHAVFIISGGYVLFFTFSIIVEISYLPGVSISKSFHKAIVSILYCINIVSNVLYALAVARMSKKRDLAFGSTAMCF